MSFVHGRARPHPPLASLQVAISATATEAGVQALGSYATQLELMQPRFPVSATGPLSIRVSWSDTFTGQGMPGTTLHFERANLLYNLAAARVRSTVHCPLPTAVRPAVARRRRAG